MIPEETKEMEYKRQKKYTKHVHVDSKKYSMTEKGGDRARRRESLGRKGERKIS